jgi:hypothetical protein
LSTVNIFGETPEKVHMDQECDQLTDFSIYEDKKLIPVYSFGMKHKIQFYIIGLRQTSNGPFIYHKNPYIFYVKCSICNREFKNTPHSLGWFARHLFNKHRICTNHIEIGESINTFEDPINSYHLYRTFRN